MICVNMRSNKETISENKLQIKTVDSERDRNKVLILWQSLLYRCNLPGISLVVPVISVTIKGHNWEMS